MAVETRNRVEALRRTALNRSTASLPLSNASSSSLLKSEPITSRYPLKGCDVVLELESVSRYEDLRNDIRNLGGRIVDTIDEKKLPFVVISDHPTASRLEAMKEMYSDNMNMTNVPRILKEAARLKVKIRSYDTFVKQFDRFKARIRSARSLSNAPHKSTPNVVGRTKEKKVRLLKKPFIKWQDSRRRYAPTYKECLTPRWTTVYFGPDAGNCVFRRLTAEELERRRKVRLLLPEDCDPPSSLGRVKSAEFGKFVKICRAVKTPRNKFCDLCCKPFDNMEEHCKSNEHSMALRTPGIYDEVDLCIGAVVDYIKFPTPSSVWLPDITPEEDEPIFPNDDSWDYEYNEGNYKCTLLDTRF